MSVGNTKKFAVKNGLKTQNIEYVSPNRQHTITNQFLDDDTLIWQGDAGDLFSLIDTLEGTIFSINNADAVPVIEADASGVIRLSQFEGNVLIGTPIDNGVDRLQVSGSVSALNFKGNVTGQVSDISNHSTDDLAEGSSNLYYTNSRVDSHLSGGTGVSYSLGEISIGQDVSTDSNVTFNNVSVDGTLNSDDITAATMTASGNVVVQGNLTVNGTTTTVNSNVVEIGDSILTLNSDLEATQEPTINGGIEINRGSETNVSLVWNETDDKWTIGSETFVAGTFEGNLTGDVTGNVTGNVTGQVSDISNHTTDDLSEGSNNLYYTDTRAKNAISATGDLFYDTTTGTLNFVEDHVTATSFDTESGNLKLEFARTFDVINYEYDNKSLPLGPDGFSFADNIRFNNDGTKVFFRASSPLAIYQYSCSTPYDISTATSDGVSFEDSADKSSIKSFTFSSDGSKLFTTNADFSLYQYSLSQNFDLSTVTYNNVFYDPSEDGIAIPQDKIRWAPDGTKFYLGSGVRISVYVVSTPFDISDVDFQTQGEQIPENGISDYAFDSTGTVLYILGTDPVIEIYYTDEPFAVPFAALFSPEETLVIPTPQEDNTFRSLEFDPSGKKMYLSGSDTDTVYQYSIGSSDIEVNLDGRYTTSEEARNLISVSGDLSYDSETGVISFTERTDAEVRGLLSGGTDIAYNSATGEIAFSNDTGYITDPGVSSISGTSDEIEVDQSTGSVTIGLPDNVVIQGNLTVKGTTTTIESNTLRIGDNIIVLNQDVTGTPTENAGIEVERGDEPNVFIRWNETNDSWQFTNDGVNYTDIATELSLQQVTDVGNTTTNNIIVGDIELADNRVQNINTNSDLVLSAQGTGYIRIDTDSALVLPIGNEASKPQGEEGMVRYNTDVTEIEFHNGNEWQSIGTKAAEDESFEAALIFG